MITYTESGAGSHFTFYFGVRLVYCNSNQQALQTIQNASTGSECVNGASTGSGLES